MKIKTFPNVVMLLYFIVANIYFPALTNDRVLYIASNVDDVDTLFQQ